MSNLNVRGWWPGVLVALCAATASCARPPAKLPVNMAGTRFPLTVTDDSGRRVTLAAPPRRIVSLAGAHTETLYALGAGERVVMADTYSNYPPAARPKAKLNCWPKVPVEQVVGLKPDLVLLLTQGDEAIRPLEAARVPVLKLFPETFARTLAEIILLGRVLGREEAARKVVGGMRTRSFKVQTRLKGARRVRVMYELDASDPARPYVAGSGGFYGEVLTLAGGQNVFADVKGPSAQVSTEQVLSRNPDVILLGDSGTPMHAQEPARVGRRPGWAGISAVRAGRIVPVDSERITRPGPRLAEGLESVARALHPDRFR